LLWDFGDSEISSMSNVAHLFTSGNHTVVLTVSNTETLCESTDTVTFYINEPAHICGLIFFDDNANGIFDTYEVIADSINLYTTNNEYIYATADGFDAYIQSGEACIFISSYNYEYQITTPILDQECEGGILIDLQPGEELCPLVIGIHMPTTSICGTMYFDGNNNGVYDSDEFPIAYQNIYANLYPFETVTVVTDTNGYYCIDALLGSNVYVNPDFSLNEFADIQPAEYYAYIYDQLPITLNFGVYYLENELDLSVDLSTNGNCVPGFETYYFLNVHNYSNLSSTATITFQYNAQQSYTFSDPFGVNNDVTQTVNWDATLEPFQSQFFTVGVLNATEMVLGDIISVASTIIETGSDPDVLISNNSSAMEQTVIGSFDPNNKLVSPQGIGVEGKISPDTEEITYTINFQNTGTAPAVNVVVTDQIDANLNIESIQLIGTSHNAEMSILGNNITWTFNNIQLPDSNANEPESHGSINYRISPIANLFDGTEIKNTANIYFDFNEAIVTNTVLNTIDFAVGTSEIFESDLIQIYPNPVSNLVNIKVENESEIKIYDTLGRQIVSKFTATNVEIIDVSDWAHGVYLISVTTKKSSGTYSLLKK
jgi:Secretion system C-terminal sorting domain